MVAATAFATFGCAEAHGTDSVQPGIYELRVEPEIDGCSPTRAIGSMGPVGVLVESGAIDAPVPDIDAPILAAPRVRLTPSTSFHRETNRRIEGCDGWVHEEWTLTTSNADGFSLLHTQRWENLIACSSGRARMPSAPEVDCTAERILRYELSGACVAPCTLRLTAGEAVRCHCP